MSPVVRLVARAVLTGIGTFCSTYLASNDLKQALVGGLAIGAGLALAELGTPLNATVGVGKGDNPA